MSQSKFDKTIKGSGSSKPVDSVDSGVSIDEASKLLLSIASNPKYWNDLILQNIYRPDFQDMMIGFIKKSSDLEIEGLISHFSETYSSHFVENNFSTFENFLFFSKFPFFDKFLKDYIRVGIDFYKDQGLDVMNDNSDAGKSYKRHLIDVAFNNAVLNIRKHKFGRMQRLPRDDCLTAVLCI